MNADTVLRAVDRVGRRSSIAVGAFVAVVAVTSLTGGPPLATG